MIYKHLTPACLNDNHCEERVTAAWQIFTQGNEVAAMIVGDCQQYTKQNGDQKHPVSSVGTLPQANVQSNRSTSRQASSWTVNCGKKIMAKFLWQRAFEFTVSQYRAGSACESDHAHEAQERRGTYTNTEASMCDARCASILHSLLISRARKKPKRVEGDVWRCHEMQCVVITKTA